MVSTLSVLQKKTLQCTQKLGGDHDLPNVWIVGIVILNRYLKKCWDYYLLFHVKEKKCDTLVDRRGGRLMADTHAENDDCS